MNQQKSVKWAFGLGIVAATTMFVKGFLLLSVIIGVIGFIKSKAAFKAGNRWAMLAGVLNILPIFYLLFVLFILGYALQR